NPQTLRRLQSRGTGDGSADWKSAIQQVRNLRSKGAKQIPGEGEARTVFSRPLSCGIASWRLTSAATVRGFKARRFPSENSLPTPPSSGERIDAAWWESRCARACKTTAKTLAKCGRIPRFDGS